MLIDLLVSREDSMIDIILLTVTVATVCIAFYFYLLVRSTNKDDLEQSTLDAFIRSGAVKKGVNKKSKKSHKTSKEKGRQVLVLYATEYGFGEELAQLLVKRIQESCVQTWQPRPLNAKHYQHIQWNLETVCFYIISTCGDGVAPTDCSFFMDFLQKPTTSMQHLNAAILALGDSSYPHFCRAGSLLEQRLQDQGVTLTFPMTKVDGENWTVIESWMTRVTNWLSSEAAPTLAGELCLDYLDWDVIEHLEEGSFSRNNPYSAVVKVKELLTDVNNRLLDRETIHCELDISGSNLKWTAGDALGIWPTNNPYTVDHILSLLNVTGQEEVSSLEKPAFRGPEQLTVRDALLWHYDIMRVTPSTLDALCQNMHISLGPEVTGALSSMVQREKYLSTRGLLQVLQDVHCHGNIKPSTDQVFSLLQTLRPLQPRFYSISSSPLLDNKTVTVTVAVVRYMTEHGEREGVTTTYLQDRLALGDRCLVFISQNPGFRLPSDTDMPLICIGAGTGLAPYRAFIQERELTKARGKLHLYFGCRHPKKDYLYREELESWQVKGTICLRLAFSRYYDDRKVYVQDLLKEDASLVWKLIKEGVVVYVCGDAGHMAPDVHITLINIVQQEGGLSAAESADYLAKMELEGRYQRDIWL